MQFCSLGEGRGLLSATGEREGVLSSARQDRVALVDDLSETEVRVGRRQLELDDEPVEFVNAQAHWQPILHRQLHQTIRLRLHLLVVQCTNYNVQCSFLNPKCIKELRAYENEL